VLLTQSIWLLRVVVVVVQLTVVVAVVLAV
jgi:hypothetical protein